MDFICDLDGTLCNIEHRRCFVATKPKNWNAFFGGIDNDTPNLPVLHIVQLLTPRNGHRLVLCSGRSEWRRPETVSWLDKWQVGYNALYMRKDKDYRSDDIVKLELLEKMREDGYNPIAAIDDRKRVCEAWIKAGLFVFDVAQGKGDF